MVGPLAPDPSLPNCGSHFQNQAQRRGQMSSEPSRHIKVTVVIPVHDAGTHLERCLASLAASVQPATAIVVVENGSTDDAAKRAQAAWPGIEFLMYARNLGFGGACNRGIQRALELGHDFVFLLNQDAMVEPDTLRRVLDLAMAHPSSHCRRGGTPSNKTQSYE
jgi:GT2 family glycosyltransferase